MSDKKTCLLNGRKGKKALLLSWFNLLLVFVASLSLGVLPALHLSLTCHSIILGSPERSKNIKNTFQKTKQHFTKQGNIVVILCFVKCCDLTFRATVWSTVSALTNSSCCVISCCLIVQQLPPTSHDNICTKCVWQKLSGICAVIDYIWINILFMLQCFVQEHTSISGKV